MNTSLAFSTKTDKIKVLLLFCLFFCIIVARRPDILFHAMPWAEDGYMWMSEMYADGWSSLFIPKNGYFQTISRIAFGIAMLFGLDNAPTVANSITVSIRCFFLLFILSDRLNFIDIRYRILAVIYFLFMPNLLEGYVNVTNLHWYTSMYLLGVVLADTPKTAAWKVHDVVAAVIAGLSGPFIAFIVPALLMKRIAERGFGFDLIRKIDAFDAVMALCCCIQAITILLTYTSSRSPAPLGASVQLLADILTCRMLLGAFFQFQDVVWIAKCNTFNMIAFCSFVAALGIAVLRSGWRLRAAVLFVVLVLGFSLAKPMISLDQPQWPCFFLGAGERYFFITNFGFFCFLLYCLNKLCAAPGKIFVGVLVALVPLCILNFSMPGINDPGYHADLEKFRAAKVGETVEIRINPPGWLMILIKKE